MELYMREKAVFFLPVNILMVWSPGFLVKFGGIGKIIPGFDSTNVSRYTGISHKLYNSTHIHDMPVICTPTGLHGITSNTV